MNIAVFKKNLDIALYGDAKQEVIRKAEKLLNGFLWDDTYETALKAANALHLLDLKRAGHSPTKTELTLMGGE